MVTRKSAESVVPSSVNVRYLGRDEPYTYLGVWGLAGCVRRARPVGCDRDYLIAITARHVTEVANTRSAYLTRP